MISAMSNSGYAHLPRFPEYNEETQNNNNNNNNNTRLSSSTTQIENKNINHNNNTEYAQTLDKLREMSEILNNITQRLQHENKTKISSSEYDELHNTVLLLYITVISMKNFVSSASDPSIIFYDPTFSAMNNNNNNNNNNYNNSNHSMSSSNNHHIINNDSNNNNSQQPFISNNNNNNNFPNTSNMMINYQSHPPSFYQYDNNNNNTSTHNLHPQHHNTFTSFPYSITQHQTSMIVNQPIPPNHNPNPIPTPIFPTNNINLQPTTTTTTTTAPSSSSSSPLLSSSPHEFLSNPAMMIGGVFTNQNQNYISPPLHPLYSHSDVTNPHPQHTIHDHSIIPSSHNNNNGGNVGGDIHLHHHNYMFNNNEQIINNNYYQNHHSHHDNDNDDDGDDDNDDDDDNECGDADFTPRIVFNHRSTSNHTTQYANIENPLPIITTNNNNNNGDEVQLLFDDYLQTYINTPKNIFIVSNPSNHQSPSSTSSSPSPSITSSSEMYHPSPSPSPSSSSSFAATLVKKEKKNSKYSPNFTQYTTTKNTSFSSPKWSSKVVPTSSSSSASASSSSSAFESSFTPRKRKFSAKNMSCFICKETATPEWRKGPDGSHSLCNACGLNYAKKIKMERQTLEKQGLSKSSIDVIINDIKFKLSKQIEDERAKKLDKKLSWKKTSPSFSSSSPPS